MSTDSLSAAALQSAKPSVLAAFRSRNFGILWVGNLLSNTGSWMQQIAEPWLVLRLSGSPTLLGLDSFAADAPVWLLILAGGVLADRRDRRKTALFFQSIQLACPLILIALLVTGRIHVAIIIALSFVVGVTDALSMPSIAAIVPSSVPEEHVGSAVALNSAQFNLSRVLGPLLAGVVMSALGVTACFVFNAVTYIPYLLAIALLRLPRPAPAVEAAQNPSEMSPRDSLREALGIFWRTPALRRAILTVLLSSLLCAPTITFVPVLIRDVLHLGSGAFGGALSAFGVGGLVGAAIVLPLQSNRVRQMVSSGAALVLSVAIIAIALGESYAGLLAAMLVAGAATVGSNTSANSILQSSIDSRLRGRAASIFTLALRGGAPLGNLVTGFVVWRLSVGTALLANGVLALGCHALLATTIRRRSQADGAQFE